MKIRIDNSWVGKLTTLIEKECALYDTRRPRSKYKKIHPSGTCYMNDIIKLVGKVIDKSKTPCCMDGCANANCNHCK